MPEPILVVAALLVAGIAVLAPLRRPPPAAVTDAQPEAAAVRHRAALEALRDVEADRRAGSLDERGYAEQLAAAEAHAAETQAEVAAAARAVPSEEVSTGRGARAAVAVAAVIGIALAGGSLLPAAGIANSTDVNEALADAEAAEAARQAEIDRLLDALEDDPRNPATLSELADAYLAGSTADDLRRAAAALQVLIALEPSRADAYERVIRAYLRAGAFTDARLALDSYQELDNADPVEAAFFDGLIALGEDDPRRALEAFDRFIELAPDDPRASMVRGLRVEAREAIGP